MEPIMSEQQTTGLTAKKTNGAAPPPDTVQLNTSNVFDNLDAIRRSRPTDLVDEKQVDVHLALRKPKPREHFRVCDDPKMSELLAVYVHKPEGSMDEESYFVMPSMEAFLREQEELRIVQAVLCRTLSGALYIWPLPVQDGDGPARPHITSARTIAREALTKWVRMRWRRSDNSYFMLKAESVQTEPEWPDRPFSELLKLAFGNRIIDSKDHPVMLELRGIKTAQKDKAETNSGTWLS
jgi:hypothetical protein